MAKLALVVVAMFALGCGGGVCSDGCPDRDNPAVEYAGDSPEECALIDFVCPGGVAFGGECGCGCIDLEPGDPALDACTSAVLFGGG